MPKNNQKTLAMKRELSSWIFTQNLLRGVKQKKLDRRQKEIQMNDRTRKK